MLEVFQQIILGFIQGITEWLPVSSSGILTLISYNFFQNLTVELLLKQILLLHLGTFFAAMIYFKEDVVKIIETIFNYNKTSKETKKIFNFLLISTFISGLIGIGILELLIFSDNFLNITGKGISFFVGLMLLITGSLQIKKKIKGLRKEKDLNFIDGIILGLAQGFSVIPGISRSGITVSSLLLRKIDDTSALRLSFLMSLPIVFFGNLILNFNELFLSFEGLIGVLSAFVFGILMIHLMMKISKKINLGYFIIGFAILMMGSIFI